MITPKYIETEVCAAVKIESAALLNKSRKTEILTPRKIVIYLQRKALDMPYEKIGRRYGKHYRTVMTGIEATRKSIDKGNVKIARIAKKLPIDLRNFLSAGLTDAQTEALRVPAVRVTALHKKPRKDSIWSDKS